MKNTCKFLIFLTVFLLMTAGLEGCADVNSEEIRDLQSQVEGQMADAADLFLEHLETKYDTMFVPILYTPDGINMSEEFRCYAVGTNKETDYVTATRSEVDGETVFHDDYFGVLIRPAYTERVQRICEDVTGTARAFVYRYTAASFSNELTASHTIDDAIAMGQSIRAYKYVFFEVQAGQEDAFRAACSQISAALAAEKLPGAVKFLGLAEGQLEHINADNYLDYLPSMIKPDGTVCLMMDSATVNAE